METLLGRDNFKGASAMKMAPFPRQFNRTFVGLGTAVGEEDPVKAGSLCEHSRQIDHGSIEKCRAAVD